MDAQRTGARSEGHDARAPAPREIGRVDPAPTPARVARPAPVAPCRRRPPVARSCATVPAPSPRPGARAGRRHPDRRRGAAAPRARRRGSRGSQARRPARRRPRRPGRRAPPTFRNEAAAGIDRRSGCARCSRCSPSPSRRAPGAESSARRDARRSGRSRRASSRPATAASPSTVGPGRRVGFNDYRLDGRARRLRLRRRLRRDLGDAARRRARPRPRRRRDRRSGPGSSRAAGIPTATAAATGAPSTGSSTRPPRAGSASCRCSPTTGPTARTAPPRRISPSTPAATAEPQDPYALSYLDYAAAVAAALRRLPRDRLLAADQRARGLDRRRLRRGRRRRRPRRLRGGRRGTRSAPPIPHHLISLGTIGGGQCGTRRADYMRANEAVDVCEIHVYDGADTGTSPTTPLPATTTRAAAISGLQRRRQAGRRRRARLRGRSRRERQPDRQRDRRRRSPTGPRFLAARVDAMQAGRPRRLPGLAARRQRSAQRRRRQLRGRPLRPGRRRHPQRHRRLHPTCRSRWLRLLRGARKLRLTQPPLSPPPEQGRRQHGCGAGPI